ncbi:Hypothetical protein A7982_07822 [Minicystis rosea]|nr:Hypothetical protein A7982_07822 [Minicystis rosea]
MRALASLVAGLAILCATTHARAAPSIPRERLPPNLGAAHESARFRITPVSGTRIAVELEVVYPPDVRLPAEDVLRVAAYTPSALEARDAEGRPLAARIIEQNIIAVRLERAGEPDVRRVRIRFEQPAPEMRLHGWRTSTGMLSLGMHGLQVARDITATIVVPKGTRLEGFDCQRDGNDTACTRTMPRNLEPLPIVLPARADALGNALLVLTTLAGAFGFARALRRRASEIVATVTVVPPPDHERPGGAYRAPPAKALGTLVDDVRDRRRLLIQRAAAIAAVAIASTLAVAVLASGRSAWPMPSVTAAAVALAALVATFALESA